MILFIAHGAEPDVASKQQHKKKRGKIYFTDEYSTIPDVMYRTNTGGT